MLQDLEKKLIFFPALVREAQKEFKSHLFSIARKFTFISHHVGQNATEHHFGLLFGSIALGSRNFLEIF